MPVKVPDLLPAIQTLQQENVFVMTHDRALHQDIRPLRIGIINLMPTKVATETQLLRLLGNTPLQVEISLIRTATYQSTHTDAAHLHAFYRTFGDILATGERFDGLIITGAPVETMEFDEVSYWNELTGIMDWARKRVFSTLYICWAAQAGLYWHYGIPKYPLPHKRVGVFEHRVLQPANPLVRGFDDRFYAPHSRYTEVRAADIAQCGQLEILAESDEAGVFLVASRDGRQVFITGHGEYERETLKAEYLRDRAKGLTDTFPLHYFPGDDPDKEPLMTWKSHANLLFSNWLNYCVYQETPYRLEELGGE